MKIVHLVDRFPQTAKYQDYYLAKYHSMKGHEVTVITSNVKLFGLNKERLQPGLMVMDGFRVIRVSGLALKNGPIILKNVCNILQTINPDLIIAHDFVYKILAWQGAFYASKHKCKIIIDNHASYINTEPKSNIFKRIYQWIHSRTLANYMFKHATAIVAIAEDEKYFLVNEYGLAPDSITIIPLGVDCELFKPNISHRALVRSAIGLEDDNVLLISTGKFDELKQIHILIQAMPRVIESHKNLRLLLVGKSQQDGYLEYLQRLIRERSLTDFIYFRNFAPSEELAGYFNAADIAVYPGSPSISIQEAMGSGLPLILTNNTSYWKDYLSNQNGLSYSFGNVDDLASKIEVLMDRNTREKMGKASRELAENQYNWKVIARRFLDLAKI